MALYHLTAKTGTRATGASALAKAQYIQREAQYARVPDRVVYATSRNLPSFAGGSAAAYWDAVDLYERRNGRLFKEIEFALPVELPPSEQRVLAESFAEELLAGERLPYTLAIHAGKGHNPHCHVLVSERVNDGAPREASQWFRRWNERSPERGGARKSRALHPRAWLEIIREKWAELVNRALERAGFLERVDHRSLEAQGLERTPQIHLGPNVIRMRERGLGTDRAEEAERIAARNRELAERQAELRIEPATREQEGPLLEASSIEAHGLGTQTEHPEFSRAGPGSRDRHAEIDTREPDAAERLRSSKPRDRALERDGPERAAGERFLAAELAPERDPAEDVHAERDRSDPTDREVHDRDSRRTRASDRRLGPTEAERDGSAREGRDRADEDEPQRERGGRERSELEPIDRTERAVSRQLRAMGCREFEIGIRDPRSTGRMMNRSWSAEQVLEHLPALKGLNARDNDIYIRPAERSRHGLVLLDDLTPAALRKMERAGRAAALVVETSPGNFQAWVRVPSRASELERGEIARRLAREYEADRGSASPRQYGRLAGFTNRKEQHRSREGLQPFALLRSASGQAAPDGELLLRQAERALRERARGLGRSRSHTELSRRPATRESQQEAVELYRGLMQELQQRTSDLSRCDFTAAVRLVDLGYDAATIRQAVHEASPDLEVRKRGHVDDYVYRTVDVAVRFHERQRARDRRRERDWTCPVSPDTWFRTNPSASTPSES